MAKTVLYLSRILPGKVVKLYFMSDVFPLDAWRHSVCYIKVISKISVTRQWYRHLTEDI